MQQVHHTMAHLACEQFVRLLCLFALGDVEEDPKHNSIGYVRVVALTPSGDPSDVISEQDAEINFVRAYYRSCCGEC
jgi:hypothetical protein